MADVAVTLDLRKMPVMERHPRVFDAWAGIKPEEVLQVINDYDPKPLKNQFAGSHKDLFEWEYASSAPGEWVVNIRKLKYPAATGEALKKKIDAALDEARPFLQADGGDVELESIDETDYVVKVKLVGKCSGCPSAEMTLRSGVENTVKRHAPEITRVEADLTPVPKKPKTGHTHGPDCSH